MKQKILEDAYVFFPGRRTDERVLYQIGDEPFFTLYARWRRQHNKENCGKETKWDLKPYCKLHFIELFLQKCREPKWLKKHRAEAWRMYVYLISDQRLLFAQTREKAGVRRQDVQQSARVAVSADAITYRQYCLNHLSMRALDYGYIFQEASTRLIDLWKMETQANPRQTWPQEAISQIFAALEMDYGRMKQGSRPQLYIPDQSHPDWEHVRVLGMTAKQYYETRLRATGLVTPEQWQEFLARNLPMLQERIRAQERYIGGQIQRYRPFLLESQEEEYNRQREQTRRMMDLIRAALEVLQACRAEKLSFREAIPLPRSLTFDAMADRYFQEMKSLCLQDEHPEGQAILFLLRTQFQTLFEIPADQREKRWERNHWQMDRLCEENRTRLESGYQFLRQMQDCADNCLRYTAKEYLSLSVPILPTESVELWYEILKPFLLGMVNSKEELSPHLLEKYRKDFYRPTTQNRQVGEWMSEAVGLYDWSSIPWQECEENHPEFAAEYRTIGSYRLKWMKCCLLEAVLVEQLVEQGYENLQSIAQILFDDMLNVS